ncbi:MAG TPA: GTP-binding protein [Herpetosiphon sp.]|uniref:Small GTP-binding protein n=2 Tax=Herpetosiphon TaxID=64 RepID=A9AYB2_HERA2|nr:ATP/GTP-binding protein [Herpetosiphon sp.]ABX03494.1 small GTP-binding protein [Herpetosiphon aurantiacus DSM 785]MCA0354571.1 ATP/GTP-binding protein [Chloroflexota bacterium]HBW51792.1 GTP-binding protein [Herpetosiphon sp.]
MQTVKMVISGAVNAGKTQFIRAISEIEVVSTERKASDDTKLLKGETTVAMDFGRITISDDLVLHLFGTPGQKRFDFMWEILSEGMLGLIVLVDSTRPETFRETNRIIDFFTSQRDAPYVVAANKQDHENAWAPDELRLALRLPAHVKIVPCVATQKDSVKNVLLELLYVIMQRSTD